MLADSSTHHERVGGVCGPDEVGEQLLVGEQVEVEVGGALSVHEQLSPHRAVIDSRDDNWNPVLSGPMEKRGFVIDPIANRPTEFDTPKALPRVFGVGFPPLILDFLQHRHEDPFDGLPVT